MLSALIDNLLRSPAGISVMYGVVVVALASCLAMGICLKINSGRLETARAKNDTLSVQLHSLGDQVTTQNAAIDQMLANAASHAERMHRAELAARNVRIITNERANYIARSVIPPACADAVTWGTHHAAEIGARWKGDRE